MEIKMDDLYGGEKRQIIRLDWLILDSAPI